MIKFGPSGNSESFYADGNKSTEQAAKWLADKGLDAFEYSFGRGTKMSDEKAEKIREKMSQYDVAVSAHAPYYINFASPDEKLIDNFNLLLSITPSPTTSSFWCNIYVPSFFLIITDLPQNKSCSCLIDKSILS